jgi:uncharacterized C2H2 Zn-finger protein
MLLITMSFCCPRCHYKTDRKSSYVDHLNRKLVCTVSFENKSIEELKEALNVCKEFACSHCNKSFTRKDNLTRHISQSHPTTINNISPTINPNTSYAHSNHNTTNNAITNNNNSNNNNVTNNTTNVTNNNNIHINVIGKEDLEHVLNDAEFLEKCIKNILQDGLVNFIERINFNPSVPQNMNVKSHRIRDPALYKVMTDDGWKLKDRDEILDQLIKLNADRLHIATQPTTEPTTEEEKEIAEFRNIKVSELRNEKRGIYRPVKNSLNAVVETQKLTKSESQNSDVLG